MLVSPECVDPSIYLVAIYLPLGLIGSFILVASITLLCDWKHRRWFYRYEEEG